MHPISPLPEASASRIYINFRKFLSNAPPRYARLYLAVKARIDSATCKLEEGVEDERFLLMQSKR